VIVKRDLGTIPSSFDIALIQCFSHDPDVNRFWVKWRDLDTISTATACRRNRPSVIGTLHTTDCVRTINRVIDMFPPSQQHQDKTTQLAETIEAVLSQILVNRTSGGRIELFFEVLLGNDGVKNVIREGKNHELYSLMQARRPTSMRTMDDSLENW